MVQRSGIRFGRIYGIDLWIHWSLLICFAYVLYLEWIQQSGWGTLLRSVVWWGASFVTILIHELGHCYAAFRQGGGADAVVLWPLGGLAYCDAPHLPRNQFWVAAGGPLAQLIPMAAAGGLMLALKMEAGLFPGAEESYLATFLGSFFWWNVVMLGFNLIPMYPLDGGRMFHALAWGRLKSHGRGTLVTVWVSRATIILVLIAGLFLRERLYSWPLFFILLWAIFETEGLRKRLLAGEGEDYVFGYDFSRGYTSLERTATRERPRARPSFMARMRARAKENRETREAEVRRRVDRLLERIAKEGLASLSRAERRFLERASRKFNRPR